MIMFGFLNPLNWKWFADRRIKRDMAVFAEAQKADADRLAAITAMRARNASLVDRVSITNIDAVAKHRAVLDGELTAQRAYRADMQRRKLAEDQARYRRESDETLSLFQTQSILSTIADSSRSESSSTTSCDSSSSDSGSSSSSDCSSSDSGSSCGSCD